MVRNRHRRPYLRLLSLLAAAALVAAGCGGGDGDDDDGASGEAEEAVTVRWFVGLGIGSEPEQQERQQAVVEEFNSTHDDIQIELEIVDNEAAFDTLSTQIAAGNAPDIVGPVGIRGSNAFSGQFLDLEPLVEDTGFDLSVFPEEQVEFWREPDGSLTALPFAAYPAFIWYNTALFDEAGLEYPPQQFGEPYADGDLWDMDKLRELAMLLSVDANGNDATNPAFDPANQVQWGFIQQWGDDARASGTMFGPGSFVADDGSAQIPEHWLAEWQWYHDLVWVDHAAPSEEQILSDTLGPDNAFNSGNVAMAYTHLWYTCCVVDDEGTARTDFNFAVPPEYNGEQTSKLHADIFRIMATTENPEAAFEVLTYLLDDASAQLFDAYGAMPVRSDQQDAFFETRDEQFTQGLEWDVVLEAMNHPDSPSHEGNMPNFNEAEARIDEFESLIEGSATADLVAEAQRLQADLTTIFAAGT
jgi:multiple sugar transport system substrate-binding protein